MKTFENVSSLKDATLRAGQLVETKGYYSPGDGGGGRYLIQDTATVDGYVDHELAGGTFAVLQYKGALNVRCAGVTEGVDAASALNAAFKHREVYIPAGTYRYYSPLELTSSINITGVGVLENYGNCMCLYAENVDDIHLDGFFIDGKSGGTLDAGLIQLNGCDNFTVQNVTLENGGAIGASSPQGVNGISIATSSYPTGNKSSGKILGCTLNNFTKAAVNWTTFAEKGCVSNCVINSCVGNGSTPAIQVNGGVDFSVSGNVIDGTEGGGIIVRSVGTSPPLGGKNVSISGNVFRNVGTLGTATAESVAIDISDGNSSGDMTNFSVSGNVVESVEAYFIRLFGVFNVAIVGNTVNDTNGVMAAENTVNVLLVDNIFNNYNASGSSSSVAVLLKNTEGCTIRGNSFYSEFTAVGDIIGAIAGSNTHTVFKDNSLNTMIGDVIDSDAFSYFTNSEFSYSKYVSIPASSNYNLQIIKINTDKVVSSTSELLAIGAVNDTHQLHIASARNTGGAAALRHSVYIFDNKNGVTTGLFFDATADSMRLRYLNDSSEILDGIIKIAVEV